LSLEDKYKTYTLFKRRVVEQAQKELQHTDMAFEFTEVKKGRKVVKLQFRIKPANEILLSEEQERASKKLETDLFLSPLQAKKIVIYVPNKEVLKTIFDIKTAQREGRIKTNIAAYAYGVFKIKYQLDLQKKLSN
jgi:plasmid replication initiation protein